MRGNLCLGRFVALFHHKFSTVISLEILIAPNALDIGS